VTGWVNPLAEEDVRLLETVSRGEFLISGFRNRDLRAILFPNQPAQTAAETKKQSAKVTRLLRLLRAHHLIAKIAKTHRYQVSKQGSEQLSALLAARRANTGKYSANPLRIMDAPVPRIREGVRIFASGVKRA
jgi:hypothetical protein